MRSCIVLFSFFLMACQTSELISSYDQSDEHVEITAIGYAPIASQPAKTKEQRLLMAIKASKLAAYRELAEQIYGQEINATTEISEGKLKDEMAQVKTNGVIKGARVIKSYPTDGYYVTELAIDIKTLKQIFHTKHQDLQQRVIRYF